MKKEMFRKQPYARPAIEVIHTLFDSDFMGTSFNNNGGHDNGNDDGQDLDAKPGFFDEEDEETTAEPKFGSIW